ncbi:MAG: protein kinase domain-containing protein, partial [Planctomycetota bacterium]
VRRDLLEAMPDDTRASTLDRFRSEAQTAAHLSHDNLVTVFEVGEHQGMYYYAMRYVEGSSLADMLRDGPLDQQRAAKYLAPIAQVLHEAHRQGILHRDLKPHNILVDAKLDRPLLADFGLAKFMERSSELTHAGELLGTPAYMSPEQATDSTRADALSDVYSLGATLYHLLTGRPPFQAASLTELIRQVTSAEPVSPRRLNPSLDRDLETICLKCLQKEPAKRYASSLALAEDLQRYLEGHPIVARPINLVGRVWRYGRRNPRTAALILLAAALTCYAVAATAVGYVRTRAALLKSESRLQLALEVVDDLFTRVSEDELLNEPGMQTLRKELLSRALQHYQYFLLESGKNEAIREGVTAARFRVGMILQLDERTWVEAARELELAAAQQRALLAELPSDEERQKTLADITNALGNLCIRQGHVKAARQAFEEAARWRLDLTKRFPDQASYQRLLANVWMNLSLVEQREQQQERALQFLEQAQQLRVGLLQRDPKSLVVRRDYAKGFARRAGLYLALNEKAKAAAEYELAVAEFDVVLKADSRSLAARADLGSVCRQLGALRAELGELAAALEMFDAARGPLQSLALGNPTVTDYQEEFVKLAMSRGGLLEELQQSERALEAWNEALQPLNELLHLDPGNQEYQQDRVIVRYALGSIQLGLQQTAAARENLQAARAELQQLIARPDSPANLKKLLADIEAELAQ